LIVFYDDNGAVVGSIDSPLEGGFRLPSNATGSIILSPEMTDKLNDPHDPAHPHDFAVLDGELILKPV
jgi:hypothetical protein